MILASTKLKVSELARGKAFRGQAREATLFMKTTPFGNESIDNAKEQLRRGRGLAGSARRSPPEAAVQCATPTRSASARRRAERERAVARVAAKVDVGFGNTLFIRGEGAGLSWDQGQPLECVDSLTWMWSAKRKGEPVTFKLLINDQLWCRGANMTVAPGAQFEVAPAF